MNFFKKLRLRRQKKMEEVTKRYEGEVLLPNHSKDSAHLKKYIVEGCEGLTKDVQDLVNNRKEYATITSYLNDIQCIENLDTPDKERLKDAAYNILQLTDTKNASLEITQRMPESQFKSMEKYKDEIPQAIKRMQENEKDQAVLKRDMDYLEGEKLEWTYEETSLTGEVRMLKRVSVLLIVLLGLLILFFMAAEMFFQKEAGIFGVIIVGGVAFGEMLTLIRILNDKTIMKQSRVNYNAAVTIQNKIKIKYVNVTNAVDYAKEKYHVSSGTEFEKQWQTYLDIAMEKDRLDRTNDDLEYYKEVMLRILHKYHLFDAGIWQFQTAALVDPKEMVEVKHALLERRGKIRKRIEFQTKSVTEGKKELYDLAVKNGILTADVKAILDSIERLLNPNERVY